MLPRTLLSTAITFLLLAFQSGSLHGRPAWQLLDYPEPGNQPNAMVWQGGAQPWAPPAEFGWKNGDYAVLVMLAGRFRFPGTTDELITRLAKVSAFRDIKYWSVTRQRWRPMINEAFALKSADKRSKRADFSLSEVNSGELLYLFQNEETPAGEVIYQLKVLPSDDRILVTMENATPVKRFGITLFGTGEYLTAYLLERENGDSWRFYLVTRVGKKPHPLVSGHEASYINRANALFRFISGIRTDMEPPLAITE